MNYMSPTEREFRFAKINGEWIYFKPFNAAFGLNYFPEHSESQYFGGAFSTAHIPEPSTQIPRAPCSPAVRRSEGLNSDSTSNSKKKRPPPWYIGFNKEFKKQLDGLDRKLLGRTLEGIAKLTENPINPQGDTIKPLDGLMKGFWRIRIGDYRLIYYPDMEYGNISLYSLSPRGDAYD
jgi:mRNA interferase RelE/StbE